MDGEKIYHYSIRYGVFTVKEGIIRRHNPNMSYHYPYVEFKYGRLMIPKMDEVGMVRSGGPSLWLFERNDELAKKLFIEYEEGYIENLQKDIDKRKELIGVIKEGIKENGK